VWNPYDKVQNEQTLQEIGAGYRRSGVTLHFPTETECTESGCGNDPFTESKKKIDCVVCNEHGYVVTWNVQTIYCRVRWIDPLRYSVQIAAGIELGDVLLHIRKNDYETVKRVLDDPNAYIIVDGQKVRPTTIQPEGIGGIDGYGIKANIHP